MKNRHLDNKGFTLVELLAVIVILAIIMIIAIPAVLDTLNSSKKKTFAEFVDKVYNLTLQKYSTDIINGNNKSGSIIYDIKNDLGMTSTGGYEGYVMLDTNSNDVYITLHNEDFELVGYHYNNTTDDITNHIDNKTSGSEAKYSAENLCSFSGGDSCVLASATDDSVIDNKEYVKNKSSYIISGTRFNYALRSLYGLPETLSTDFTNVTAIKRSTTLNSSANKVDVSLEGSEYKTYVWADGSIVYYYTDSPSKIILNSNSAYMFYKMVNITELDLSIFDTSNVTDMSYMFGVLSSITSLDLSHFDTSNVKTFNRMFFFDQKLENLNLSRFNTSKVEVMNAMFYTCRALTNLNVSSFNTANVKDMNSMFYGCEAIKTFDLSNFNTSSVTDVSSMFSYCNSLETIYVSSKWNMTNVTASDYMFRNCRKLKNYDANALDVTKANYSNTGYLSEK